MSVLLSVVLTMTLLFFVLTSIPNDSAPTGSLSVWNLVLLPVIRSILSPKRRLRINLRWGVVVVEGLLRYLFQECV